MRRILVAVMILVSFVSIMITSCGINNTTKTFSIKIMGENDVILLSENDLSIVCRNNDTLTYKDCVLYALTSDNVEFELSDDDKRIISMFGFTELFDEPYEDRGAYWYMELNHNQIIDMIETKVNDGDAIEISWKVFDRHKICD